MRYGCLVVWWLLLLAVVIRSSTAETTDPSIVAWVAKATGGALHIEWTISAAWTSNNLVDDIENFRVLVEDQERATVATDTMGYDLYGLTNNTAYTVQVNATFISGSSAEPLYSDVIAASTLDRTTPDAPDAPKQLAVTGGFVQVGVEPPADTGGADLVSVTVIVRSSDSLSVVTQQSLSPENSALLTYNIYGLDALTTYRISAYSANEGDLTSLESAHLVVTTKTLQLPDPCPSPKVISTTGASVVLQLIPPLDDGGGRIQGYNVYMTTDDVGIYKEVASTIDTDTINTVEILQASETGDEALLPETSYFFKAVAINLVDICISVAASLQLANATEARTAAASVPGPPPSPYFLKATGGMITMSMMTPANMQGANCTGFSITVDDDNGNSFKNSIESVDDATYDVASLQANSSYMISVAIITNLGTSLYSTPTTMNTTVPTSPTAPRDIAVVNITGSSAIMTWSPPRDNGGVVITGYTMILISLGSQEERPAVSSPTLLRDLVANTLYTVKVVATNALGKKSTRSMGVTFKTLSPTPPNKPSGISSVFSSGGAIEVAWNPPDDRGGELLSTMGYKIAIYSATPCFDNDAASSCSTCNSVKLSAGHHELIDNASLCERPTTECLDGTLDCCLTREDSEYGLGYSCERMKAPSAPRSVVGTTSAVFNGLNYSSTYYFGVQAINHAGKSTISNLQGLQTTSQTSPSYPSNLRQLTATGGSIQLTWDSPRDTGGGPIVGYRVYRNYDLLTPGYVMPPYSDCGGMVAETTYVYGVSAVNASLAEGSMVSTKLSTEMVLSPLQPSLSLIKRMYNRLQVSANTPCDTGGDTTLTYQFTVKYDDTLVTSANFECCRFIIDSLEPSRSYTVAVRVGNELFMSQWAEAKFTTTSGVPSTPVATLVHVNTYSVVVTLGSPSSDKETNSYDVYIYQDDTEIQHQTITCQEDVDGGQYVCPTSQRMEALEPETEYEVTVQANGPLGSSVSDSVSFNTISVRTGTFGMSKTDYYADKDGGISTVVLRSGGTSGSIDVGVDVTEPSTVLVRCEGVTGGGCYCTLYLTSSGAVSDPCSLNFIDGQDSANVSFSMWNDESAELLPSPIVVAPFGVTLSSQHAALLHTDACQQPGFVSFSMSASKVLESSLYAMVDVVRLNGTTGKISFGFETFDMSATAGDDYIPASGTVVMSDQQSGTQVWLELIDNHVINEDKAFGLRLKDQSLEAGGDILITHKVVILDDENILDAVPSKMDSAAIVYTTGGEFEIKWTSFSSDAATVLGYMVRVTPASAGQISNLYNTTLSLFTMSGLSPRSTYRVEIAAWNSFGLGEYSDAIEVATTDITLPSLPLSLTTIDVTNTNLTVGWEPPRDDGGSAIVGYRVVVKDANGIVLLSESIDDAKLLFVADGLIASTTYNCYVFSATEAFPDNSDESSSAQISVLTAVGAVPGPPPAVTLLGQPRGGTLTFFMNRPKYTGGMLLTSATLYLRQAPEDGSSTYVGFAAVCQINLSEQNDGNCTVRKLLAITSYEMYATFSNDKGEGAPGEANIFQTTSAIDLPSAPLNLRATDVTAGKIKLEWDIPVDLGGASNIVGYIVYQKFDPSGTSYFTLYDGQDSTEQSVTARGLTKGSAYAFAVVALNDASFCADPSMYDLSSFLEVMTLSYSRLSPPGEPFLVSRTGGAITIGWQSPDDLAGIPLQGYRIELAISVSNDFQLLTDSLSSDTTTFTHYGLSESTSYSYTVTAVNEDGPSERSVVFTATTSSVSQPGLVQNFHYVDSSGGSISLAWDPPQDTGGRQIERYEISRIGRSDSFYATTTTFDDRFNLIAMTDYSYTITAFNGFYRGYTAATTAATGKPSLSDPLVLNAVPFGGRLGISWAKPENTGGISINAYVITLLTADGSTIIESTSTSDVSYNFSELLANTAYILSGKVLNDVGESPMVEYDVETGPPDVPSAPPQPTATNIQGGRIDIHVENTEYTGGQDVTMILYMDGKMVYTFSADERDTTIYGLVAETKYSFSVSAKNTAGEAKSGVLKITTTTISNPGQVQNLQLESVTYNQMSLTWDKVQDTGGNEHLQYKVTYFKSSSEGTPEESDQLQISYTNAALVEGLQYSSFYSVTIMALTSTNLVGSASSSIIVGTKQPFEGVIVAASSEVNVREDAGVVSIPIDRVNGSYGDVSYTFDTLDDSAIQGANYQQTTGTKTLTDNIQSDSIDIPIVNDEVYNPGISFLVAITDSTTALQTTTRVILQDDGDAGFVSFAQPSLAFLENNGNVSLDITRTGGSSPQAHIKLMVVMNASSMDRFHLLDSVVTFEEGDTHEAVSVQIIDDSEFQLVPDSITIGFEILDGGVLNGTYTTIMITALDNGDISKPKQSLNIRQVSVTGGALGLTWTQPIDHGGADVTLSYLVSIVAGNQPAITQSSSTETTVIYGLNQSKTYQVFVQAINSAGAGLPSTPLLISTLAATPPTAPLNIQILSASSSSVLISWDAPLDDGGSPIVAYTIYQVTSTNTRSPFPSISCSAMRVCSIKQLLALTSYNIQIQPSTAFVTQGTFSDVIMLTTSSPDYPDTPPIAVVSWVSAGAMTIQMFDPVNVGGSNIQEYILFIRAENDADFTLIYSGVSSEYTVYHLQYQTVYYIKYQVANSVGPSADSPIKTNQTLSKSLPSAPLNARVIYKTGGAITLAWDEPLDIGGRDVTGYMIKIVSINGNSTSVIGYDGKTIPSRQGSVYGLTANTEYGMQVVALLEVSNCFDSALQAWSSVIQSPTTTATAPRTAPQLLVGRFTGGIIELVWVAPKDQGGIPLTGYTLNLVAVTGISSVLFSTSDANVLSFVHNDLTASTNYSYTITTSNSVGTSPISPVLVAATDMITFPSAPLNVQQLSYATGGAITIGWDRSVDTGGQPIAGYMVYRNGELVSGTLSLTSRSFIDKNGLTASTSYNYAVRAIAQNAMVSMASDECLAETIVATNPQRALSLGAAPGSSFLNVSWVPDGDTGGLPVISYEVKLMLGSTMVGTYSGTTSFYLFKGLTASTVYIGSIKIYNDVGASDELTASLSTTSMTVPSSPDGPLVVAVFGGNFTIQISSPIFTGGSPITALRVFESTQGSAVTLKVTGSAPLSYTFFGVNATTDYFVSCSAINLAGEGPQSNRVGIRTATLSPPGQILAAPAFVVATGTTLSFTWNLPADTGGSLSLTYEVRVVNSTTSAINPCVSLSYTAMQLAFNSSYDVSVRAVNNNGTGAWSPVRTATTQPDAAGEFNFAQTSVSVLENATNVALVVQRTSGLSGRITLSYSTGPTGAQPATLGAGYAVVKDSSTTTGTIVFDPLQNQNLIVILIINDAVYEYPDETFAVRITRVVSSLPEGTPKIGSNNVVTVTILDDGDAGYVSFEQPEYSFREDAGTGTVTIIREYGKSTSISLAFEFWGGTATPDVDYRKTTTPVVMDDGVTKATLTFSIINDKIFEYPDEYFFIRMSVLSGGAILRQPVTRVTILDDGDVSDPGPCPPPELQRVTGGLATFATDLPDHNGSATGSISYYIVHLSTDATSVDFNKTVALTITIGNLTASTVYNITIAAGSPFGQGSFSSPTQFSTTAPSLPGAITPMFVESRTGGRISLAWFPPDDTGGIPITKYRIKVSDAPQLAVENSEPITRTTVYGLNASSTYAFSIQAGNALTNKDGWGDASSLFNFSTTAATQPGPVVVSPDPYKAATGGKVYLSWNAPLDTGGTDISSYLIFARSSSLPWILSATALPSLNPLFSPVTTLNASTTYEFFVIAENSVPPVKLPGKLSISEGSKLLHTSIDLSSWLSIGSVIAIQNSVFVVTDMSSAAAGSITLKYNHLTTSILSQTGVITGEATTFAVLNTSDPTLPDLPPAPVLSISTGGMINMTLLSPDDTGGIPILDFSLYWDGEKLNDDTYVKTISKLNYLQARAFVSVSGLKSVTKYKVSAVAINSLSLCNFGRVTTGPDGIFQTTNTTPPGAPLLVTYRTTGGGITMTVVDPYDTGGNDIQLYLLYYKRNGTSSPWQLFYSGPKHQATVAHLTPLTDYALIASVYNGYFSSVNSSVKVVRTINKSPPGSCEAATYVNATGGMLSVSWDYPADDGGSTVTGFYATIASHSDGSGRTTVKTNTTSCKFYRLMAESSYDVVIRANNSYGLGPESPIATFNTTTATPPVGDIEVLVQMTTGGAAHISFGEPIDLGGAPASDMTYNIFLDRDNTINMSYATLEEATSASSSGTRRLTENVHRRLETSMTFSNVVIGNMDPQTLYGIQILPTSNYANGGISSSFDVETVGATIPTSPVNLQRGTLTGGSVSVSWGASVDTGGIPINEYSLSMSNTSKDGPFTEVYKDLPLAATVYQLKPNTMYWSYVTAWNDVGESPPSGVIAFTTRSVTPPSAPQNFRITAVGYNSVKCAWDPPSDIGGDTIDSYTISATKTDDSTVSVAFMTQGASTSLTGLSVSTSYSISVIAQNTFGDSSPPSLTRYARTSSGPNTPSTPQIGCVSHNSVELLWYPFPGATTYHVVRGGTEIDTTTSSSFTDTVSLSTATSYAIWTTSASLLSSDVSVTTLDPTHSTTDAICQGNLGHISELNYANQVTKQWTITPMTSYSYITLTFSTFELECDHDYVQIIDASTEEVLWRGGCVRTGSFVYQAKSSVIISFTSDDSVTAKGFEMQYELDGSTESTRIPSPGNGIVCSGHGRSQSDGTCKCSVGFTGEGCNNRIVCCSDPQRCHHSVCDMDPTNVIVVSGEFGDDIQGTGQLMNASEKGTASKAVRTIARAVELSTTGSVIFVYPGVYSGSRNRDLKVNSADLTISTLKGPYWTSVNCEQTSRFLAATSSTMVMEGLTLQNCLEVNGGVFNIVGGSFSGTNMLITDASASQNGGAFYASGSNIILYQVSIVSCSASKEGGAIYLEGSITSMIESNVTESTAARGGAMALRGTSSLSTTNTEFFGNTALESGGGAYVNGVVSLKGAQLVDNEAPSGGGLAMDNGNLNMEDCVVSNNTAEIGGGGLALSGTSILVTLSTFFRNNKAAATGGGVYITGTANVTFDKQVTSPSTITDNTALNGAGIYVYDADATFQGIDVENGYANESAGGVAIVDSTVEWLNVVIQENQALEGGGVVLKNSQLICKGPVLITENDAVNGGAIWMNSSTMTGAVGTHCLSNTATDNGGAIFVIGDTTVENVKQELNEAPQGGCMNVEDATLSLVSTNIVSCSAAMAGGGIWMKDSEITVKDVSLSLDTAPDGGGLYATASSVSGDITIESCSGVNHGGGMYLTGKTTVVGANVDNCDANEGGAAYATDSDLTIEESTLSNSRSSENGGGIYAISSNVQMTDTIIADDTSNVLGGGAYLETSTIFHDGVSVERCNSNIGGGVYLKGSKIMAKTPSSSSNISENVAVQDGGNMFMSELCSVEQLIVSSGKAESGGGIAMDSISATIQTCSILNNTATFAGGIDIQSGSTCIMIASNISWNTAEEYGGGIGMSDANISHHNLSVLSNIAPIGGGVFARGVSSILKQRNNSPQALFQSNNATPVELLTGYGGGLYIAPSSQVDTSGLAFFDANADRGAGVYVDSATFVLNDALFQNGNASNGGGIYASDVSTIELVDCSFIQNNASQSGGGISSSGGQTGSNTLSMSNCSLTGNTAGVGGGIMLSLTTLNGFDTVLNHNAAKSGGAVAVISACSVTLSTWDFINNTVVKNELGVQGGTMYITKGTITVTDSRMVSNERATLALNGGLIYIENADTTLNIVNSLLEFGQAYSGGLIYSSNAHIFIKNSTLHRGFAYDFGAGILAVNTLLDISDSFFYDNFAFYDGGAIYMTDNGQLTVDGSFFDLNAVQDRGGAVFLNPGATVACTISNSNFTRNTNVGFGSTIFVGRKNSAHLSNCVVSDNGDSNTEGGTLNVIDASVTIADSLFERNIAGKGAAIQISRWSTLTMTKTIIRNNSASIQGGALHASIRAVASFTDSIIEGNAAAEGGAVYALGSASITVTNTDFKNNTASSFGGAISMRGSSVLTVTGSVFKSNDAYTGGGVSIQNNASLSVTNSQFQDNNASDFGAGIYIDMSTSTSPLVSCETSSFGGNVAAAGNDIYWVYYSWFTFHCVDCTTLTGSDGVFVSTSAVFVTPGWWPPSVTSGVSLGVKIPSSSNSGSASSSASRRLSISSQDETASLNASLVKPGSNVLWPTVVVRDFYGAIATYDNVTRCQTALLPGEEGPFTFTPLTWVTVNEGYIVFESAEVLSRSRDNPYPLYINCTMSPVLQNSTIVNVTVETCNPGYENVNGLCLPCEKGTYSLDGEKCYLCPLGGSCEQKDSSGTIIGVITPIRQQGYYVSQTRSTYAASSCDNPESWSNDDPCKSLDVDNLASRIHQCATKYSVTFYTYWSRSRVYSCLSGNEYYACDTNAACVQALTNSTTSTVSISTASVQSSDQSSDQCSVGYGGIMCAICTDGYYKSSSGTCKQCTDPKDPAVARTTHILAMLPIIVAIAAFVFLFYLFSNTAEQRVISHAQAASRFQIYAGQSRARVLLQAAKAKFQQRARSMIKAVVKRARFGKRTEPYLFQIEPREADVPSLRPEKFKIMLGFFQVIGSFKEVYEIPWPDTMSRLMDISSLADFNFVDTTATECLFKRDYFSNYRLALFALLGMLVLVFLVTFWGILRYRVKLSTLPRHCVNCGLPVFTLEHRPPPALERRATLLTKLKLERNMNIEEADVGKMSLLARMRSTLWTSPKKAFEDAGNWRVVRLVVRGLKWVDRVTQLPASISTHKPRCPTSQRIKNDVLDMVVHSNLRLWRARVWMRLYYKAYQNRCIKLFFWVLLLFYPMLCQRVIGMFYCDEVGDHYYLNLDRRNLCYEGTWLFYLPVGITLIIFWVIGVPLLFWVIIYMKRSRGVSDKLLLIQDDSQEVLKQSLLLKMRLDIIDHGQIVDEEQIKLFETEMLTHFLCDRNLNEPSTVAQVGFIYHSYDTHFWWFEVWELGRKLLLNCIISLLAKAGTNRIICGLVVLLVYLSVMLFYKPYRESSDSALAGVIHIQLFITLFCGLILKMGLLYLDERVVRLVTNAAIVSCVMTLIYAVFSIINERRCAIKKAERLVRDDHQRAIAAHTRKLWRKAYGYALTEVYMDNPDVGPMPLVVMMELARRVRYQQEIDDLNAQVELTSTINPLPSADDRQDTALSASQINVLEDAAGSPDENRDVVETDEVDMQTSSSTLTKTPGEAAEPNVQTEERTPKT